MKENLFFDKHGNEKLDNHAQPQHLKLTPYQNYVLFNKKNSFEVARRTLLAFLPIATVSSAAIAHCIATNSLKAANAPDAILSASLNGGAIFALVMCAPALLTAINYNCYKQCLKHCEKNLQENTK